MSTFIRRFFLLIGVMLLSATAFAAEKRSFSTNAPMIVAAGEPFRVEFSLNAKPDDDTFVAPDFSGFEVIAGPSVYRGQSVQFVNGTMTQTYEFTYTYVLLPTTAGNFTIGQAEVKVEGESLKTEPVPIEVVKEGGSQPAEPRQERGEAAPTPEERANEQVSTEDILLRISLSRSSVYKGEPVVAAVKLYYRIPIVGINNVKYPSFNGFWTQELESGNRQPQRETLGGKVYESTVLMEYLLYPQQSGQLSIEPAELEAVAQVVVQNRRSRDPFFGNMPDIYNVTKKLRSPKVNISVKELPAGAPQSFTGAVGRFTLSATPPTSQLKVNSAATYTIRIAGSGNLRFVQAPKINLPTSFELYEIKSTEQIKSSVGGASGYRQFEYPFIARAEGEYDIAPVEFTYFDPSKGQYVTLSTQPLHLNIDLDGSSNERDGEVLIRNIQREDVRLLSEDIRFIKSGKANLHHVSKPLIFSSIYYISFISIIVIGILLYVVLKRRIRESHNIILVRGKRANKVAIQRFKAAKRAMSEGNQYSFYEEMSRALWGYMSDKLNIPAANLTKENVREELHKRGVDNEETHSFSSIITQCEEAQYSPQASAQMSDVYKSGVEFISRMESAIKKKR